MLLRLAIGLSILFLFFIELNINTFVSNYKEKFEAKIEKGVRAQAWRNLEMMEHSIKADLRQYVDRGDFISRELVFKMVNDHGQSYIGSSTGNIFVLDLEDNSLFYTNNIDFDDVKHSDNKHFTENDLYKLTKDSGGNMDSVKRAWNEKLIYKADNPPADKVSWNIDGEEKWLVCKTLPSTTSGFNKHSSALEKAFQIKICQTVEKRDILRKYDDLRDGLYQQKIFILNMIRGLVLLFLMAVIADFVVRRYKLKNGLDRRKHSMEDCQVCHNYKSCDIYNRLVLTISDDHELQKLVQEKEDKLNNSEK